MAIADSFATKYRPTKLSEIIGQPVVKKAFSNAFKYNNLHHAYILAGKFGCGKTTIARIVAAMENCDEGFGKDPCGKCDNCREILEGRSFEVHEIDAASKGKVEGIRDLQKIIQNSPVKCRTRYVILDEAHSLTKEAAEASLKMIEEPPKHVRFILCTTEPQAFKPTIHSRCITWRLSKVTPLEIAAHLKDISEREKINIEEKALNIISRSSQGSVRNSLHNLQTVINYAGEDSITSKMVVEALGEIDERMYFVMVSSIINQDYISAIKAIQSIFLNGQTIDKVIDGMFRHLNNILMVSVCKSSIEYFGFSEAEKKYYEEQSKGLSKNMIKRMMTLLNEVAMGVEYGVDPEKLFTKYIVDCIDSKASE